MRAIIACAGTGGHINPGIAIANIIKQRQDDSEILFIGTKSGLENELVKKAGYEIKHIRTGKLIRSLTTKNIKAMYDTYRGIGDAKKIVKDFMPDVIIGTGGYICGPVMLAAQSFKIPYVLHESNAFPGIAVKLLAKKAACVMIGFKEAKERLGNRDNVIFTGTPTKFNEQDMFNLDIDECKKELKLTDKDIGKDRKIILVTGGSQGAKKFNEVVLNMIKKYLDKNIFVVLVTGQKNHESILEKVRVIKDEENIDLSKYVRIEKFIYDMDKIYKTADLCITRSGAMTITELGTAGKPSILIPFPFATENHQLYNAQVLEKAGAAKVIIEDELNEKNLYEVINEIVDGKSKLEKMGINAKKVLKKDTEESIYENIFKVIQKR